MAQLGLSPPTLDPVQMGTPPALQRAIQPGSMSLAYGMTRLGPTTPVLDSLHLGLTLTLRGHF